MQVSNSFYFRVSREIAWAFVVATIVFLYILVVESFFVGGDLILYREVYQFSSSHGF